ncbi:MAG: restriction endonuclease [Candidatus Sedimenticola sp. 6PFRAG7]
MSEADLIIDKIYGGSRKGNAADDPLPTLLGVDSGAGFRHLGERPGLNTLKLLVLKTNFKNLNWPDHLDQETGLLTYYGDNHKPRDIHDTPRKGNAILRNLYEFAHDTSRTSQFPPIFVFGGTGVYRDVRFLGLAVPSAEGMSHDEDLVAVWRSSPDGIRFQNYRAVMTILDIPRITRQWIRDIQAGNAEESPHAPEEWKKWIKLRKYKPLLSEPRSKVRSRTDQLPSDADDQEIVQTIYKRYCNSPTDFEKCAAEIARMGLRGITRYELTRPWRDGGRDATGGYRIGTGAGSIEVEFSLEAKCYSENNGVGVKELSRLLSRLRHRQFGVMVTTSYLSPQAYNELIDDGHPVIVISAVDIADILKKKIGTAAHIEAWLDRL